VNTTTGRASRWNEAKTALDAVLSQEPRKREAFLDRLCRGDRELLVEVRSLLAAYDDDYLEAPAAPLALTALSKSPKPPRTIGPYRISKKLGSGGMGEVYKVVDREGRELAVKRLLRQQASPQEMTRLRREAKAAQALEHPNIVRIVELIDHMGAPVIVMEYLDGRNLSAILKGRRLDVPLALRIAMSVAEGLACAHAMGIVHRDIKPGNIFVTRSGDTKILDFGIVKILEAMDLGPDGDTLTKSGDILGTAGYMAPEQANGEKVDARADVFSFGCVLYETLSSRQAFGGASAIERRVAILRKEPTRLREVVPSVPDALETFVHRCLEKNAEDRPADGGALVVELERLSGAIDASACER